MRLTHATPRKSKGEMGGVVLPMREGGTCFLEDTYLTNETSDTSMVMAESTPLSADGAGYHH
jgi:hypothetical protein